MRKIEQRYATEDSTSSERARRLVALLSIGLERLFTRRSGDGVDFSGDLSVTTSDRGDDERNLDS